MGSDEHRGSKGVTMTSKNNFVYRITDQDYHNQCAPNYRDALKLQKEMYADGAERVGIAKEYLS